MPVALAAAYTSLFSSSGASASSVLIVGSISQTLRATIDCSLAAGMQVSVAVDGEIWVNEMSSKYTRMKERIIPIHRDLDTTVKRLTGGEGVELSVCCLGDSISRLAARCLAYSGRFWS